MSDRWFVLLPAAVLVAAAAVAVAQAGPRTEPLRLDANGGHVAASAAIVGASLHVTVDGARPGARVTAVIDRLACAQQGYGGVTAGGAVADRSGHASWTVRDVVGRSVRDGRHVLAVGAGGRTVACGSIAAPQPSSQPPEGRRWGIWAFTRRFVD